VERLAARKVHFAPLERQSRAIDKLLRSGRFRNVTEFMRAAIDHYLDNLGRPSLAAQAREMAIEWERRKGADAEADDLQADSRESDERW
jgi:Arc/MetJ-type ribon-helix-helix transcriptional regulator